MSPPFHNREYWEDRLRAHYDLEGVGYLRLGRRYNRWMYRVRGGVFDRVVRELPLMGPREAEGEERHESRPTTHDPQVVLDVGPGTGFYVERWLRLGAQVTGVDLTQVAVENLRARFPGARLLRVDIGLPLGPPLADEADRFDAVSAFDVLFHVVDDGQYSQALRNIAALLRPGGWFLWSDNFIHRPTVRVAHQVSRSLEEATAAVRSAGLEIVERVPMFVLMNYPADARSRATQLAWTAMVSPAMASDWLGGILGAVLFPLESWLVRQVRESPSTELMVCRK